MGDYDLRLTAATINPVSGKTDFRSLHPGNGLDAFKLLRVVRFVPYIGLQVAVERRFIPLHYDVVSCNAICQLAEAIVCSDILHRRNVVGQKCVFVCLHISQTLGAGTEDIIRDKLQVNLLSHIFLQEWYFQKRVVHADELTP